MAKLCAIGIAVLVSSSLIVQQATSCPFMGIPPAGHPRIPSMRHLNTHASQDRSDRYERALAELDLQAVKADLKLLFVDSQSWWPADYGHYGPFFIRLAWHCSGSYRLSDGRGGCDGGRQRFDPERSWEDNTNLDKARRLLLPLKEKYGIALSWGDLFTLAGTTAIESMGGPVLGFCAGRQDAADGSESLELGPSELQEELYKCQVQGDCKEPLGSTTVGLIYLNPEGPMGVPNPEGSFPQIRDTFARMGMNDSETVALIGGGHAFGKTHGACPAGAGEPPNVDPLNPWPGLCGTGVGKDAFTSGFEGPWTTDPTKWDNTYFKALLNVDWEVHTGPGDHFQWRAIRDSPAGPAPDGNGTQNIMMLTSDVSLLRDPAYKALVEKFADNQLEFDIAFSHAWYKLTSRDVGPVTRCVGDEVPPAQPFQNPLPPPSPPSALPPFERVKEFIALSIKTANPVFPPDQYDGSPDYGPLFVRLAWQCASTFRATDFRGGCNGARIRYSPEKDSAANVDLDGALKVLEPIKEEFGEALSWADLIALAGTVALEQAGAKVMPFCGGRTDAADGEGSIDLGLKVTGDDTDTDGLLNEVIKTIGLTRQEFVALVGGGHTLGQMHPVRSGFEGQWTATPTTFSNSYFVTLMNENWVEHLARPSGKKQYKAAGKSLYMLKSDILMRTDPALAAICVEYASDNELFLNDFESAWTKLMNVDRFDGPTGNLCETQSVLLPPLSAPKTLPKTAFVKDV